MLRFFWGELDTSCKPHASWVFDRWTSSSPAQPQPRARLHRALFFTDNQDMSFAGSWYSTWWGCIQCIWCLQVLFHRARRRGSVAPPAKPCCSCNFWDPGAMCESGEWGKVSVLGMCCLDFFIQGGNTYDSYDDYMNHIIRFLKMGMSTGDFEWVDENSIVAFRFRDLWGTSTSSSSQCNSGWSLKLIWKMPGFSRCHYATLWHCPMTCTRL